MRATLARQSAVSCASRPCPTAAREARAGSRGTGAARDAGDPTRAVVPMRSWPRGRPQLPSEGSCGAFSGLAGSERTSFDEGQPVREQADTMS